MKKLFNIIMTAVAAALLSMTAFADNGSGSELPAIYWISLIVGAAAIVFIVVYIAVKKNDNKKV